MKKFFLQHWHYLLVIPPLFIFVFSIWDRNFYIGGDVMIPLNPLNNIWKIFLWNNGIESFQYAYFFWFAFYYLFSLIGFSAFIIQKILLVLLLIIGFTFTYLSYKEFFRNTKYSDDKLAFLAAVIFTFNPIYFLLVNAYLPLCGFPVCFYFLIKFLQKGKILYAVLFSILLNVFFFIDLPQPKLLIVFGVACLFLALLYQQMRAVSFKNISIRLIIIFSLGILLNLWIFISIFHSLFFGVAATFAKNLVTYGGNADFKTATVLYTSRFFNYNIVRCYPHLKHFLTRPVFILWTFTQWIILVSGIFFVAKDRKGQKIIYTLLIMILFFIFIAKGANPPFGQLYRYAIIHFPLARIFRTTSSVITGAVVFYAFLFSISTYHLSGLFKKKKAIVYIIIVLNITIFYPLYFGHKFYNQLNSAPNQKGYAIPDEYYEIGKLLDNIKEDSKVLSIPLGGGYVKKNWPYFGPDILSWITRKPLIYKSVVGYGLSVKNKKDIQIIPENYKTYSLYNVGYLLLQKDTVSEYSYKYKDINPGALLIRNDYFDLYKISDEYFLPHIYSSHAPTIIAGDIEALVPMTETKIIFKKINPTKYLVKVEGAKTPFRLVFSESFHKQWRLYSQQTTDHRPQIFNDIVADYPKLKVKEAKHLMKFTPKDIKYLFRKPLDAQHQLVNGYANGWYIEPKKLGLGEDFTLVIYFWPQTLFYLGLGISGLTLLCCLIYLAYRCFPFSVKRRGRG